MRALLATEFTALLARADISQAAFAPLTGYTTRQVNNWCRAKAAVPPWAAALAVLMRETSPDAMQMLVAKLTFPWHETLGLPPNADPATIRHARASPAQAYHPDRGGSPEQMARIHAAYQRARPP